MRRTPALILGGGPAGATVALALARAGRPHLLLERTRATGDALCGGFLSWRTLATLERLGIAGDTLNPLAVGRLALFARGRIAYADLPYPARGVSRHMLDRRMTAAAVDAGATIERGVTVRQLADDIAHTDAGDYAGDAIFLATGKHDVRGAARPRGAAGTDPTLGLRVRLRATPRVAREVSGTIELHLFDRGYAGIVQQEDGSLNICLAIHRSRLTEAGDPHALFVRLAQTHPILGERLALLDERTRIDAIANVPYGWRTRAGAAGLYRLGDQAGVIPSLAGEGLGIAVESGRRAAEYYLRHGPTGAIDYQRTLSRDLARPMGIAAGLRAVAERPSGAMLVVALSRIVPALPNAIARLTRIG